MTADPGSEECYGKIWSLKCPNCGGYAELVVLFDKFNDAYVAIAIACKTHSGCGIDGYEARQEYLKNHDRTQ